MAGTVRAAAAAGCQATEWRVLAPGPFPWEDRNSLRFEDLSRDLAALQGLLEASGLRLLGLLARVSLTDTRRSRHLLRAAQGLGCRYLALASPSLSDREDFSLVWGRTRRALAELQEEAGERGIRILVETHMATVTPSAALVRRLLEGFSPRRVGAIYDPANGVREGGEDPRLAVTLLGPYLAHVHVKDCAWFRRGERWQAEWVPLGEGMVDWPRVLEALGQQNYHGWWGMEDLSLRSEADLSRCLARWQEMLSAAAGQEAALSPGLPRRVSPGDDRQTSHGGERSE